jgi:hypothetical protein
MPTVQTIWVVHTTSTRTNADTDGGFTLIINGISGDQVAALQFPDLPHDERERGRTDEYRFADLSRFRILSESIDDNTFCIRARSDDAWLPKTVWIIGQTEEGDYTLLAGDGSWPTDQWFSTQASDANSAVERCVPAA